MAALSVLLYLVFPLLCVGAMAPDGRRNPLAERIVLGVALYEFLLLAIGLALGLAHVLAPRVYMGAIGLASIPLLVRTLRNGLPHPRRASFWRWMRTRRGMVLAALGALLLAVFVSQVGFDFFFGTRHYDGLWYHIPRMLFWLQQRSFDAWGTPAWPQIGLPVGADVVLGQKIFLGSGWAGVGWVSGVLSVGAGAALYLAAVSFKLTRWSALMSVLLFASFPAIGQRFWTVNSDMTAAFPVLASYVILCRLRDARVAFSLFFLLNCMAIACKPTIFPYVLLLGLLGLWRCRSRISSLRQPLLPLVGLMAGILVIFASYWPVYRAFSDFQGGEKGRGHKVASAGEFKDAVAMNTAHWLLDPLGYPAQAGIIHKDSVGTVYRIFGAKSAELPDEWMPAPTQDVGRTGIATILMIPLLIAGLPRGRRLLAASLLLVGFVFSSGIVHFQPWNARYTIVLLAGYSLLWCATRFFRRNPWRWLLVGLVAANLCGLGLVTAVAAYRDRTVHSARGGYYDYIGKDDRKTIASTLTGRPLLVITSESLDALLVGTGVDYPLEYLECPAKDDGNWVRLLGRASARSSWVAVVHRGKTSFLAGPDFQRAGTHECSVISKSVLNDALAASGWKLYRRGVHVDLWRSL